MAIVVVICKLPFYALAFLVRRPLALVIVVAGVIAIIAMTNAGKGTEQAVAIPEWQKDAPAVAFVIPTPSRLYYSNAEPVNNVLAPPVYYYEGGEWLKTKQPLPLLPGQYRVIPRGG